MKNYHAVLQKFFGEFLQKFVQTFSSQLSLDILPGTQRIPLWKFFGLPHKFFTNSTISPEKIFFYGSLQKFLESFLHEFFQKIHKKSSCFWNSSIRLSENSLGKSPINFFWNCFMDCFKNSSKDNTENLPWFPSEITPGLLS